MVNQLKFLGKWYNDSLSDQNFQHLKTRRLAEENYRSTLSGKYQHSIYQYSLLLRLMWLLVMFEVPQTAVASTSKDDSK